MYDVKPQIKTLLEAIPGIKKVSDAYPSDWKNLPQITFYEQDNSDYLKKGLLSEIVIQIDIWHSKSTGEIARRVDEKMAEIGFRREFAADIPDPAVKHKTMRFRGIVDERDLKVYQ
jgi:hypothetical protein